MILPIVILLIANLIWCGILVAVDRENGHHMPSVMLLLLNIFGLAYLSL